MDNHIAKGELKKMNKISLGASNIEDYSKKYLGYTNLQKI